MLEHCPQWSMKELQSGENAISNLKKHDIGKRTKDVDSQCVNGCQKGESQVNRFTMDSPQSF